jgi:hypothetical protein
VSPFRDLPIARNTGRRDGKASHLVTTKDQLAAIRCEHSTEVIWVVMLENMAQTIPMKTIALCLLLCTFPAVAKDLKAPLPEKLFEAKTVYIDNRSGQSDILDKAYTALKEWNRYEIIQDKAKADIVFAFTVSSETRGSYTTGNVDDNGTVQATTTPTRVGHTTMAVLDPTDGQILFSDTRRWHLFGSAMKDAVKELRKRMEPSK